jgi:adenylyltransferase/sulfurtransferase
MYLGLYATIYADYTEPWNVAGCKLAPQLSAGNSTIFFDLNASTVHTTHANMGSLEETCASLRAQIIATEEQLAGLKRDLAKAEAQSAIPASENQSERRWPLLQEEYKRYGRQMIVPQVGLKGKIVSWETLGLLADRVSAGQLKLRSAKVLLVGAGGLGCPAAQYLAGAGVGTIGLIDGDTVEVSNLHRQVLHRTQNVGKYKVDSAIESLREYVNPIYKPWI